MCAPTINSLDISERGGGGGGGGGRGVGGGGVEVICCIHKGVGLPEKPTYQHPNDIHELGYWLTG